MIIVNGHLRRLMGFVLEDLDGTRLFGEKNFSKKFPILERRLIEY